MGIILEFLFGILVIGSVVFFLLGVNPIDLLARYIVQNNHIHSWGMWEKKQVKMYKTMSGVKIPHSDFVQVYQERKCKTCGKIEHRELQY